MSRGNPRKTAYVETYGCQMNLSDGELMEGILVGDGYGIVDSPEEADVILVNTCAIREHAERRVLGRVGQLNRVKRERSGVVLGVTGCMAQRMGEELLERAPHVDLVMGPDGYRSLPGKLAELRGEAGAPDAGETTEDAVADAEGEGSASPAAGNGAGPRKGDGPRRLAVLDFEPHENYEGLEVRRTSGVSAWVPIQRGCDHRCTYCIVPYVRGDEKNRDPEEVVREIREVAASGIPEVTLLGQTVNSWTRDGWSFARLLREVARVRGIRRVRYTSPHPNDVTPELVEAMAEEEAVCEHLHLPVQAGHDGTLKRMLRRYTVEAFLEKVGMIREAIPEIALSTDVIVGFPKETEEEFEATLELMREVRFDDAFTYRFSSRDGTPATRMPEEWFVEEEVAQRRLERLIEVQRSIQAEIAAGEVGRVEEVLVESTAKSEGDVLGRTRRNKVVAFPGTPSAIGTFVDVKLTGTTGATFTGVPRELPVLSASA